MCKRVIAILALLILSAQPALALELIFAEPLANKILASAPSAVTLTASSELSEMGSSVTVSSTSGKEVDDGSLLIEGPNALIGLKELTQSGKYQVKYQLMSIAGEILSGSYYFTFEAPAAIASPLNSLSPDSEIKAGNENKGEGKSAGDNSKVADIFMASLLVISILILIAITRLIRKPKPKKRKRK